jgi:hypothetical protein
MSVRSPPSPYWITGICSHGGGASIVMIDTHSAGATPPIECWSP